MPNTSSASDLALRMAAIEQKLQAIVAAKASVAARTPASGMQVTDDDQLETIGQGDGTAPNPTLADEGSQIFSGGARRERRALSQTAADSDPVISAAALPAAPAQQPPAAWDAILSDVSAHPLDALIKAINAYTQQQAAHAAAEEASMREAISLMRRIEAATLETNNVLWNFIAAYTEQIQFPRQGPVEVLYATRDDGDGERSGGAQG
ncbi:hypothetical protein HYDPIDRAFT_167728 [Hydnomerulius pinastri MD-312]|uniref:Uncharacterized protein n=1 Tax=Hydnomerulius pinastri MD-312 TaxID=994086 RepID=A0A0C9VH84_9AGAM|nr:hypothetical protein HYDPIDRAFT_167728 [Hydnomerulius pinastri MD-312]